MTVRWQSSASCLTHDPQLWDEDAAPAAQQEARRVCAGCPVAAECEADAVALRTSGTRAGTLFRDGKRVRGGRFDVAMASAARRAALRLAPPGSAIACAVCGAAFRRVRASVTCSAACQAQRRRDQWREHARRRRAVRQEREAS